MVFFTIGSQASSLLTNSGGINKEETVAECIKKCKKRMTNRFIVLSCIVFFVSCKASDEFRDLGFPHHLLHDKIISHIRRNSSIISTLHEEPLLLIIGTIRNHDCFR